MLKKKFFRFDKKKPSFCEKLGSQLKFCAYVIYEWYLKHLSQCSHWNGFSKVDISPVRVGSSVSATDWFTISSWLLIKQWNFVPVERVWNQAKI